MAINFVESNYVKIPRLSYLLIGGPFDPLKLWSSMYDMKRIEERVRTVKELCKSDRYSPNEKHFNFDDVCNSRKNELYLHGSKSY